MKRLLAALLGCFCLGLVVAQDANVTDKPRLKYEARIGELQAKFVEESREAHAQTLSKLDDIIKAETAKGDLDKVLLAKTEKTRLEKYEPVPKGNVPYLLQPVRAFYDSKLTATRKTYDAAARAAHTELLAELDAAVKDETKAGRIDAAIAAREYRKSVEKMLPMAPTFTAGDVSVQAPREASNVIISKTTGMKFVRIPKGTFLMGSDAADAYSGEKTVHEVTISRDFYLGVYEVTQKEYSAVMGKKPSKFLGDNLPVESLSWEEAVAFAKALSEKDGKEYRLPTEAEWEYACRAGEKGTYGFPTNSRLEDYAWFRTNSDAKTHPVGTKKANAFGLYDMHGNVWEWCSDWYKEYESGRVTDPTGPGTGSGRVGRGGGWNSLPRLCRTAYRYGITPGDRSSGLGIRLALIPSAR